MRIVQTLKGVARNGTLVSASATNAPVPTPGALCWFLSGEVEVHSALTLADSGVIGTL